MAHMLRAVVLVVTLYSITECFSSVSAQSQTAMENDEMAEMLGGTRFGRGKDKKAPVTKADLPYIRCGVCEGVAKHAVAAVKTMRSEATVVKKVRLGMARSDLRSAGTACMQLHMFALSD